MIIRVICIDNYGQGLYLTLNKQYKMSVDIPISTLYSDSVVYITNDLGHLSWYARCRFIKLEEYREKQLNKLLQ